MSVSKKKKASQIGIKTCPKCRRKVIKPYFKFHRCPLKPDGSIDKWEGWGGKKKK